MTESPFLTLAGQGCDGAGSAAAFGANTASVRAPVYFYGNHRGDGVWSRCVIYQPGTVSRLEDSETTDWLAGKK